MKDTLVQAFASPLMLRRNIGSTALNTRLASTVRSLAASNISDDAGRAHQGGYYSDGGLFQKNLPGLEAIKTLAVQNVERYILKLNNNQPVQAHCTINGWAALTRQHDYQTPHVHSEATISGVYYVEVPNKPAPQGCIDLLSPLDSKELTFIKEDAAGYCRIKPQAGDLLMFPAYIKHLTHPFLGDGERICIVFNALLQQPRRR